MRWPPPTFLAGQGFNVPFQQRASNPLLAFARLQEKYKQHFETRYSPQPIRSAQVTLRHFHHQSSRNSANTRPFPPALIKNSA